MSYAAYRNLITELRSQDKTTGPNQSDDFLRYTDLNIGRMNKWDKHFSLSPAHQEALTRISQPERWLVLTEAWCGDAAHVIPILAKLANAAEMVELGLVLRDENLELMDQFLTNGGRSIPKLIRINTQWEVLGTFGPRPAEAQNLMLQMKQDGEDKAEINKALQIWYARNRGLAIADELLGI